METFRIEVGHTHQVKPGNIVGAIANEAGIDSALIGRISIFDDHSTIDLPTGMPQEMFLTLQKVWVAGQQLSISRLNAAAPFERSTVERTAVEHPAAKRLATKASGESVGKKPTAKKSLAKPKKPLDRQAAIKVKAKAKKLKPAVVSS